MASFQDLGWAQGVPEGLVRFWVANNLMVHGNVARRGSPYLLVRYEDVVADPERQFRDICELLGVDFDPAMLSDERRYQQFESHREIADDSRTIAAGYAAVGDILGASTFVVPTDAPDERYTVATAGFSMVLRGGRQREAGGAIVGGLSAFLQIKTVQNLLHYDDRVTTGGFRYEF